MTESLVLHVPTCNSWEQRGVLACQSRSRVAACRSRERPGSFLRARDFLAALFLPRWHLAERVPPRGHAPWGQGAFLRGRRLRRPRSFVARELVKLGGDPVYREGFVTDNGNIILDVHNMDLSAPISIEQRINQITGVVTNGLFACRPANVLLMGTTDGVKTLTAKG